MATAGTTFLASQYNSWYSTLVALQTKWNVTTTSRTMAAGTIADDAIINSTLRTDLNNFATNAKAKGYTNYPDASTVTSITNVSAGTLIQGLLDTNIANLLATWNNVCLNNSVNSTFGTCSTQTTCTTCTQCCNDNPIYSQFSEQAVS